MHELSIAYNLVEIAQSEAEAAGARGVEAVHLRLGGLAGVVREALLFSYEIAVKETLLEGSRLVIEDVPVMVYCAECGQTSTLESVQLLVCKHCGTPTMDIRQGRELEIRSLEIADESPTNS